jgi:hypothetical protein
MIIDIHTVRRSFPSATTTTGEARMSVQSQSTTMAGIA